MKLTAAKRAEWPDRLPAGTVVAYRVGRAGPCAWVARTALGTLRIRLRADGPWLPLPEPWGLPPLWRGQTVVVLASGPSLDPADVAYVRSRNVPVIAVNRTWERAPWADVLYGCDGKFWRWPSGERARKEFAGLKVTLDLLAACEFGLFWLKETGQDDYDPFPGFVRTGRNSGYQAVHLALQGAARRVLLLGFDQKPAADGRIHWHENHPTPTSRTVFDRCMRPHWPGLLNGMALTGAEIVNCTTETVLDTFPRADLRDVL